MSKPWAKILQFLTGLCMKDMSGVLAEMRVETHIAKFSVLIGSKTAIEGIL